MQTLVLCLLGALGVMVVLVLLLTMAYDEMVRRRRG